MMPCSLAAGSYLWRPLNHAELHASISHLGDKTNERLCLCDTNIQQLLTEAFEVVRGELVEDTFEGLLLGFFLRIISKGDTNLQRFARER